MLLGNTFTDYYSEGSALLVFQFSVFHKSYTFASMNLYFFVVGRF